MHSNISSLSRFFYNFHSCLLFPSIPLLTEIPATAAFVDCNYLSALGDFMVVDCWLCVLVDLCGTPGYLAPEVLKASMYEDAPGYGKPVDMYVNCLLQQAL